MRWLLLALVACSSKPSPPPPALDPPLFEVRDPRLHELFEAGVLQPDYRRVDVAIRYVTAEHCDALLDRALDIAIAEPPGDANHITAWIGFASRLNTPAERARIAAGLTKWQRNHAEHRDRVAAMIKRLSALP